MTWLVKHISVSIDATLETVVAVAGDPAQLPLWAQGLSLGIRNEDGRWFAQSPMGEVEVRFTGSIGSGILDHDVTLPDGSVVHNPLRVLHNDRGSEVVFSIFQREGMTDAEFHEDAERVRADLRRLCALIMQES